jgi:hypothetical protein
MPKRLHATERWDKEWYQSLSCKHKCFWEYLTSKCDAAGVWEPNYKMASFVIGEPVTEQDLDVFNGNIRKLDGGKVLLVKFCAFQYGELSEHCKPHASVLKLIAKHGIAKEVREGYGE